MDQAITQSGIGIYGKMPSKRDFIALHLPGPILSIVERWLQGGVAASKNLMGANWQDTYLTAPIWRFWIGEEIAGTYCIGSIMPSVDGVGRYFPLAILAHGSNEETLLPPLDDPLVPWFEMIEGRLLSALNPDTATDAFGMLEGLPAPGDYRKSAPKVRSSEIRRGIMWSGRTRPDASDKPAGDREEDYRIAAQTRTYWWTNGGERFGPRFYSHPGMPDPSVYVNFLTGEV